MSRTIDEKVVEMRFDNRDFERNVSQSMSTLDKLKSALDFSGAEKAFSGITSAANKLDFGPLGGAIEGVGQKFSALETMAVGALMNIGATIESKLVNTLKSVSIDQVTAGWDKYAKKTTAVQTIMNATGKEIDEVSKKLDALNWFTDETSYNFTDMTNNIGKFTSQRVDLDDAVVAMEGISTAAALAGQNAASASRVMYNFSQALGMGSVQVRDWMSVENANMATEEFRQTIIDTAVELGRLDKYGNFLFDVGKGYSGPNYVDALNFRDTLAADWFNSEVLIESLKKYGGFSSRLNEVYNQFNETYDVTTSQILTWLREYMEGTLNVNEAVEMTGLAAEEILPILEELSSDEYELGRKALTAAQEAKTFEDVVNATADAVSTAWMNVFEKIFGNYEEARVTWTQLSNELWDIFAGPISRLNVLLTNWHDMGGRDDFIQSVKNMYRAVRSFLDPIGEAWDSVFPPKTADDIYNFTKRLKEFSESLILDETRVDQIRMVFEDFFGIFKAFSTAFRDGGGFGKFFEGIGGILKNGTDRIYDFLLGVQRIRSAISDYESGNIGDIGIVQGIKEAYPDAAKFLETYDKILKTVETLGQVFGNLFDYTEYLKDGAISFDSVIDGIETKISNILTAVGDIVKLWTGKDISSTLENVQNIISDIADGLKAFVGHEGWGRVKDGILDVGAALKDTFGPAFRAVMTIFSDWLEGIHMILGGTNGDLDGFFNTIVNGLGHIADFIRSGKGAMEFISDFLVKFLSLTDAINTYQENGGGILGILSVVHEKLKLILDTIADLIQNVTGFDVHGIGSSILSVIEGIGYAILQVADTISKAFGWKDNPFGKLLGTLGQGPEGEGFDLSGVFDKIADAFQRFGDLVNKVAPGVSVLLRTVGDAFKNLWELIGQVRLEDLIRIFQALASIGLIMEAKKALSILGDTLEAYQRKLKADMLFAIAGAILAIAGAAFLISKIDTEKIGLVLGTLGIAFAGIIGTLFISKFANAKSLAALPGSILAIATAMVILAKAAKLMAEPIQMFADMKDFWAGMGRLGTVMGSFGALLGILGALNKSGMVNGAAKALGKLAGVLAIMLPLVLVYSKIDFGKLAIGIAQMTAALTPLLGAVASLELLESLLGKIFSSVSLNSIGGGLFKFAGALALFTGIMLALTLIDWNDFLSSLGKLTVGLVALVAAVAAFSFSLAIISPVLGLLDKFATSLLKLGTAILFISAGVGLLGIVATILGDSAQTIAEAGVNLIVTVLDAIVARTPEIAEDIVLFIIGVLRAVADHTPEIVAIAVEILGGIMQGIRDAMSEGGINLGDFLAGSGILAGLIGLVWLLKKMKLNIGDFGNAALALAGAAVLITEIGFIFGALGALSATLGGAEKIKAFGEVCSAIVGVFTEDWGVIALFAAVAGLLVVFDKFKLGAIGGGALLKVIGVISEVSLVVEAMGLIFAAFGGINDFIEKLFGGEEGSMVEKINKFGEMVGAVVGVISNAIGQLIGGIVGGTIEGTMKGFADGLAYIANTAGEFFTLMDSLQPGTLEGCKLFADMIMALTAADILDSLWIFNGKVNYKDFAQGLADLAPGIAAFAEQTKDIDQGAVEKAAACAQMITAFAKDIPNDGGLISWFTGNNNIGDFADGIKKLAPALSEFSENAKGIDEDAVAKAGNCADIIIAFSRKIPNSGLSLMSILFGDNDMAVFAEKLPLFAKGLVSFSNIIGGVGNRLANQPLELPKLNVEAVEASSSAITAIIDIAKSIPVENAGWKWFTEGNNSLANFGTNLTTFATSLVSYSQTLGSEDFKLTAVKNVTSAIQDIVDMAVTISGEGEKGVDKLDDFGKNLKSFGSSFKGYYSSMKDVDSGKASKLATAISDTINAFIGSSDTSLATKVATLTTEFLDKLVAAFSSDTAKKKSEEATDKFVDFFRDRLKTDSSINKISIAVTGMVSKAIGEPELKEGLKQSGIGLVGEIQNGITEAFEGEDGLQAKFAGFLNTLLQTISRDGRDDRVRKFFDAGANLINGFKNGMFNDSAVAGGVSGATEIKTEFQNLLTSLIGMIVSEEIKGQFQRGGASLMASFAVGMRSSTIVADAADIGKNVTLGYANGIADKEATEIVKKNVTKLGTESAANLAKSVDVRSPSRITTLIGQYFVEGFSNGVYDKIPNAKESILALGNAIKDGLNQNDIIGMAKKFGLDLNGNLDDAISAYVQKFGAMDFLNDTDSVVDTLFSSLSNASFGEIGTGWFDNIANGFMQSAYDNMSNISDTVSFATEDTSSLFEGYSATNYDIGYEGGYSWGDGLSNGIVDGMSGAETTILSACDHLEDVTSDKMSTVMTNALSYTDWLAKEYPEGITIPTPVYDFDDLKLQAGELEGILTAFDNKNDNEKDKMIVEYALHDQEDLANFLKRYWLDEPIRLENQQKQLDAITGYQAYLESQRAAQEVQAIQQQEAYTGIQAIATDMNDSQKANDEKVNLALEEIKMHVAFIRQELDGVHEDINRLNEMDVYLDGDALVGATADKMDNALGYKSRMNERKVTR